jgi:hypothetical protein
VIGSPFCEGAIQVTKTNSFEFVVVGVSGTDGIVAQRINIGFDG